MDVGVLALQGDVSEHRAILSSLGATVVELRSARDVARVDALVLPGGESTAMSVLLRASDLVDPLRERIAAGVPTLGTCAGMILLAEEVLDGRPDQVRLAAVDITVRRNAFGRQVNSFEADLDATALAADGLDTSPIHAVFIRAPGVVRVGPSVEVLATLAPRPGVTAPEPVLLRQGSVVVAAFHPELVGERRVHQLLLGALRQAASA